MTNSKNSVGAACSTDCNKICPCVFRHDPNNYAAMVQELDILAQRQGLLVQPMDYDEALSYIHGRLRFGIKEGLDRIEGLCHILGNPQDNLKVIHVAGTNGKGSVCAMISRVLSTAKYNTGLYISPYITDFCERMQINGHSISHEVLAAIAGVVKAAAEKLEREQGEYATEFEIVTAIAFLWYSLTECDYVVLETGLGGRLDATNIIKSPLCSVIMAIDYDHTDILGDTLTKIAAEKCGIIKEEHPVILFPNQQDEALAEIKRQCALKNCELVIPDKDEFALLGCDVEGTRFLYKDEIYNLSLLGEHQSLNAITAIEALKTLEKQGVFIGQSNIEHGLLHTVFPCRLQIVSRKPLVIIDGAHNPNAAIVLKKSIDKILGGRQIFAVCGMLKDKDYEECMRIVAPSLHAVHTVPVSNPRALSPQELCECVKRYCPDVVPFDSQKQAVSAAIERMQSDDVLLVFGSLYLASDVYSFIDKAIKE